MAGLDDALRDGYLRRLGLAAEPPSVDALIRLHRAHVERVAWETLWIHLGEWWPLEPAATIARIAERGRGGYCFHLNGAAYVLLESLGYAVELHAAAVGRPGSNGSLTHPDHLTLTVADLPTETNPGGRWLLDVGLGSGLHDPLPLEPGEMQQHGALFRLADSDAGDTVQRWRLFRTPPTGWESIGWRDEPAMLGTFDASHSWLSRSPDSPFAQVPTVQRWGDHGVDVLRGLTLNESDGRVSTICSLVELLTTLTDRFGIDLSGTAARSLDQLWRDLATGHQAWVDAGRP